MAGGRAERDSRHYYEHGDYPEDEHERDRERRAHRRHRSHRNRDDDDEYYAAKRERRERRRAEEARREAELDIDELRARRASYFERPEEDRRRESQRMAQEIRAEREKPRREVREVRRDGTVRRKKRRERVVEDDRSDEYVYGRPGSREPIEEVTVKRSSGRRRSEEGGSSSHTRHTPLSGSRSTSRGEAAKLSRSYSARDPARVYMASRPSVRRTSTTKLPTPLTSPIHRTQSLSVRDPNAARKSTGGFLGAIFGAPPPRRSTTIRHIEGPRLVDCTVCMSDDIPTSKSVKLGCGHRMCHSCLKRQFTLSVSDPQHMPPRCCTADHIPLKYVERLFDDKFKRVWNKKYQEYTTGNRLYCPNRGCGEWIKPSKIRMDMTYGRKYARCGRCNTKVCVLCNGKFHTRRECPRDEETNRLVQMAKDKGWQRCYSCKALVELKEGCNHMTCRCTAQFCMVCAAPWKTCNCPWFNYQHLDEDDRLNDMRVPYEVPRHDVVEVIEMPDDPDPPVRRISTRVRHRGERDHTIDRTDEVIAAALQHSLRLEHTATPSETRRSNPAVQVYGLGNGGDHHMNDSYTLRPLANSARTVARNSTSNWTAPRFFSRRLSTREAPRAVHTRHVSAPTVTASTMAGLSRDGRKVGANRVGTWLNHVEIDEEATHTAARGVEVDDWRVEGSMIGID